jgi:Carboxypeptidase regulatory-like domain/TonB dependent receptor
LKEILGMNFLRQSILAALVLSVAAMAQSLGTLRGTILDPSGAAIPKATVTATGPNNTVKVAQTDDNGAYTINGLPPGKYTIRVIATGFTLVEKAGVDVSAGRPMQFDAKLVLETSKQEVTVADTQQVELDPAKNAGALVLKEEDLDMLSDDPDDLEADLLALAGPAAGPNGGQFFIDGFSSGQLPPKDSIREIRINSNPFSAEYDTSGRGRIEIFTKPGTEKFHGSVNLIYSDHIWDARNPFAATPGFSVPASDTKNLQANFSGPIIKKKMSFFIDFSRRQQREDQLVTAEVLGSNCTSLTFLTPCTPLSQSYGVLQPNYFNNISPRLTYQLTPNISLDMRYRWQGSELYNGGVSGFSLPNSAYTQHGTNNTVQFTETQVVSASVINESHFQFFSQDTNQTGVNPELNISVADAFTSGSTFPEDFTHQKNYEYQNYTSITHGTQFIKFGGRLRYTQLGSYNTSNFLGQFNFDSLASYAIMEQGIAAGLPLPQIIAAGGGPYQYIFAAGQPLINVNQFDAGLFFQDDWKVLPSLTVSLGLRYEVQDNIPDHGDWAPRIGIAWGIGPSQGRLRNPKTVLRGGYGFFYDRFAIANVLNTVRFNGINDVAYTIPNPTFFPGAGVAIPALNTLESPQYAESAQTDHLDSSYRSPRMQQAAIGLDRQLPKNVTLSINYINSLGFHILRTDDINTPLPGTWNPLNPMASVYPLGYSKGIYDLYESSGFYDQNQLIFNVNGRINSKISLFGYYAYGHVNTNVPNPGGAPSNPYDFNEDYGRANYDIRHRVSVNGSILAPLGIRLSPNIVFNSSPPLNLTEGIDPVGDGLTTTARPALAPAGFSAPACTSALASALVTCMVSGTKYGSFVINPPAGLPEIASNGLSAFPQFNFNLRISRTWGFGESTTTQNNQRRGGAGGGPGGPGFGRAAGGGGGGRGGAGGGPGGGGGGLFGDSSGKKYTLTASVMFHNLFNTVNPGQIETDLLSPRLGEPLAQANVGGYTGNANSQAFNRRIDFSLRFAF